MQSIFDAITEWLKGLLVEGIMGNLGGLFTGVNEQVGEIAAQVGMTPAAWNAGVFSMIRQLSETVILPIAGLVLTFVMTYELIQMLIDHNNLHNFDTWMERFEHICHALNSLPDAQGQRVFEHYLLNHSVKAIAAAEGVTERAINAAIQRGLENMKKYLEKVL